MFDLQEAHKHCSYHKEEIEKSYLCGCFYCKRKFEPKEIKEWIDQGQTAICTCGIDSVIGDASGYEITDEFLTKMNEYWFDIQMFCNSEE